MHYIYTTIVRCIGWTYIYTTFFTKSLFSESFCKGGSWSQKCKCQYQLLPSLSRQFKCIMPWNAHTWPGWGGRRSPAIADSSPAVTPASSPPHALQDGLHVRGEAAAVAYSVRHSVLSECVNVYIHAPTRPGVAWARSERARSSGFWVDGVDTRTL